MANTYTTQTRLHAVNGNNLVRDGDPMHSAVPHDLMAGMNNLTYVSPYASFASGTSRESDGRPVISFTENSTATTTTESFLFQLPTILPRNAYRFNWTLDFYHESTAYSYDVTINEVNVYIAQYPYTASVYSIPGTLSVLSDIAFDSDNIGGPFGLSSFTSAGTFSASTSVFKLCDFSTANVVDWMPFANPTRNGSPLNHVWLIVTFKRHATGFQSLNNESMRVGNFSWWTTHE